MLILIKDEAFLDNSRIFKIMCEKSALKEGACICGPGMSGVFICQDMFLPVMQIRLCKNLAIIAAKIFNLSKVLCIVKLYNCSQQKTALVRHLQQ